ncbi:MAG TPA: hypothetical protein GXX35_11505 [Thermoanaerobacterales bacterium]|nr:hypothetical protein [Thermoanaerobacterales bacterium]
MPYKHGVYGEIIPSIEQITYGQGTIPVYIGTAPVHRLAEYSGAVNTPVLINSLDEAKTKLGYVENDDFDDFTLAAVVYGHFKNKIQPIGPFIFINVLDPATHKTTGTASVTLVDGKGYIDDYVILNSISITGEVKGIDYTAEYTTDGRVLITDIGGGLVSPVTVSFDKVDLTAVQDSDIIGSYDPATGKRTGLSCVQTIYEELNIVPSILSAPGWNHKPAVETELVSACFKIGGHWDAICVTDIDPTNAKTIDAAINWKKTNNYTSNREKVCWPKVKVGDKTLWMSIMAIIRMQQTDYINDGVPYESPSNKQLDITGLVLGDGTEIKLNSEDGNKLNEKGITTAVYFGGKWVLWGPHMANYEYGVTTKPEEIFDVNIRTNLYLTNDFQVRNASLVDTPIARNDIDDILNTEQLRLNALISEGKLLYGTVEFRPESNPTSDLMQGDFVFDTMVTNTPPGKSLTTRVQYTSQGLNSLTGGEA